MKGAALLTAVLIFLTVNHCVDCFDTWTFCKTGQTDTVEFLQNVECPNGELISLQQANCRHCGEGNPEACPTDTFISFRALCDNNNACAPNICAAGYEMANMEWNCLLD